MSKRDPKIPLRHMLDYARRAVELSKDRTRNDLDEDITFNLALTRLIEIIGEAANRVSDEFQKGYSEIP